MPGPTTDRQIPYLQEIRRVAGDDDPMKALEMFVGRMVQTDLRREATRTVSNHGARWGWLRR